jgi:hypothetical protein
MKRCFLAAAALALALAPGMASAQYSSKNYSAQGGAKWVVGGELDILGTLNINGVPAKTARGESALGGSNPTAITTGLVGIVACSVSLKVTTAPGVGTSLVTYGTSGGTLNLYGWKVTSNANPTLVASTGTETVGWICAGS